MKSEHSDSKYEPGNRKKLAGYASIIGGILAVILAPIMVIIKYMTGWSIVPEPGWIASISPAIDRLFSFATPVQLWVIYGLLYSGALSLMYIGLITLWRAIKPASNKTQKISYWIFLLGFTLVLIGDCVHTATWHQNGLTVPTPGTNLIANTAYATAMMGMNLILVGSLIFGISALRKKLLAPWLAWLFILITPAAPTITLTLLPTTPSGSLLLFSVMMILLGYSFLSRPLSYAKITDKLSKQQ